MAADRMTNEEREQELRNALGSLYRVRMATRYDDLGRDGVSEIVLAETLTNRAIHRARGKKPGKLPTMLREMRQELERGGTD